MTDPYDGLTSSSFSYKEEIVVKRKRRSSDGIANTEVVGTLPAGLHYLAARSTQALAFKVFRQGA